MSQSRDRFLGGLSAARECRSLVEWRAEREALAKDKQKSLMSTANAHQAKSTPHANEAIDEAQLPRLTRKVKRDNEANHARR